MAEVRKRLAQYYQEQAPGCELRIELQPGSYVPVFRFAPVPLEQTPAMLAEHDTPRVISHRLAGARLYWLIAAAAAFVVACCAILALRSFWQARDPIVKFWGPVLTSPGQVLLCIGNLEGGRGTEPALEHDDLRMLTMGDFHRLSSQTLHISDATALATFAGFLQARKKPWRIATQSRAGLNDLGSGPAVLIGLMNNNWTERLVGKLRFRVVRPAPHKIVIQDARDPSRTEWSMDYSTPLLSITKDYALVLRVLDPRTDQMVVAAAGISVFGTLAATEFLTNERELRSLDEVAPPGWQHKNIELVLSTEVVRAESGRPRIVAVHIW